MEECYNLGRFDLIDQFFAPDLVNHDPVAPQARDLASFKQFLVAQHAAYPDRHATIEELVAEDDGVVKRTTFRGTQTGEFGGIPPTGKQVTLTTISIYRCSRGKIEEIWWGYDMLNVLQQLGALPTVEQTA